MTTQSTPQMKHPQVMSSSAQKLREPVLQEVVSCTAPKANTHTAVITKLAAYTRSAARTLPVQKVKPSPFKSTLHSLSSCCSQNRTGLTSTLAEQILAEQIQTRCCTEANHL
jgi:hypothetical protein